MPATAATRRHVLPPLRPQEEYFSPLPAGPLRRWFNRIAGGEAGLLLARRPDSGAARGTAAGKRPTMREMG